MAAPTGLKLTLKNNTRLVIYCTIGPATYSGGASLKNYVYTTSRGKIKYHGNNLITVTLDEGSADQSNVVITLYAVDTAGQKSNTVTLTVTPKNYWRTFYGNKEVKKIYQNTTKATLAARKEKIFYIYKDYQQKTYAQMGQKTYNQLRVKGFN